MKQTYQTRHLVSLVDRVSGGKPLKAGDRFEATETDAAYYVLHGWARAADAATKSAIAGEVRHQQAQTQAAAHGAEDGSERAKAPKPPVTEKAPAAPVSTSTAPVASPAHAPRAAGKTAAKTAAKTTHGRGRSSSK
jgi:hypothetical protein